MQTPPPSPLRGTRFESPLPGTPSEILPVDLFGTPSKRKGRYEDVSPERTCPKTPDKIPAMPSPPKKRKGSSKPATLNLPILTQMLVFLGLLGKGSFGEVYSVCFPPPAGSPSGTPNSPPIAVKIVKPGKVGPKALKEEAANFDSPGCAQGVAMQGDDETYYGFSSIATPLSKMTEIGAEMLESVIQMMKPAIMVAPIGVVYDCKPENLGFIPKGTPTVKVGVDGQPCVGDLTEEDQVVFIDNGMIRSPEEADKNYNPLIDDEDMEMDKAKLTFRKFKCKMMEALLRNQFALNPLDDCDIVAPLCVEYGYTYATGVRGQ